MNELQYMSDEAIQNNIDSVEERKKTIYDSQMLNNMNRLLGRLYAEQKRRRDKEQHQFELASLLAQHEKWFDKGYRSNKVHPYTKPKFYTIRVTDSDDTVQQRFIVEHRDTESSPITSTSYITESQFLQIVIIGLKEQL